jgi:hypothetical protein
MNRAVAASLFAVLALASCAGLQSRAERELQVPPVEVRVEHRAGALLGPIAAAGGADTLKADDALAVEARAVWLESAPSGGVPLASRAKLVSAERGGEAIEARSRLAGGARLLRGVEAQAALARPGRTREISREELALPAGVTATLALLEERTVRGEDGDLLRRELRAEIGRSARGELAVALILEDLLAEDLELDEDAAEDPQFATRRECLLLDDAPEVGEAPLVIFVPQEEPYAGLVLGIVLRASGPAALSSVTRALEQARAAERAARARTAWLGTKEARQKQIETALGALENTERRRAALLFLAAESGAELCADVALDADETLLANCARAIAAQVPDAARLAADGGTLGWALERGCTRFLAERATQEPLPLELYAAVLRRTGELGRSPASLLDVVVKAKSLEEFHAAVATENRILLEDSHPATRVRAFDWLAARGLAPANFDPLASDDERDAALETSGSGG